MLSRRDKLLVQPWEDRRFKDHRSKVSDYKEVDLKCVWKLIDLQFFFAFVVSKAHENLKKML